MAVFRVEKSSDYTVMSNHHLRNHALSLKAKGLLSQMLSLPEEWDYTLAGLAEINKESKDAIRSAVEELEQAGYIQRRQTQDKTGKFSGNEYVIREMPVPPDAEQECPPDVDNDGGQPEPDTASPLLDFPTTEKPSTENPSPEKLLTENPTELNKDISSKDIKKKNKKKKTDLPGVLSEDDLRKQIENSIRAIASPGWNRDDMNRLYILLVELYNPERAVRKAHPMRTQKSIANTFGKLKKWAGSDPGLMADIVDEAIANGWQGIQPPNGGGRPPASASAEDEVIRTWI